MNPATAASDPIEEQIEMDGPLILHAQGKISISRPSASSSAPDNPDDAPRGWMHATHYHCKDCNGEMEFWGRIGRKGAAGVRAVGVCKSCELIFVELEYGKPKWVAV